jgi:hypothetical protein
MGTEQRSSLEAPPALLAIIQAARRAGDRGLERAARAELAERHGIEIVFRRERRRRREEAARA